MTNHKTKVEYLISLGFEKVHVENEWEQYVLRIDYRKLNGKNLHTCSVLIRENTDHTIISIDYKKEKENLFVGRIGSTSQLMYILSCTYINDLTK